MRSAGISEIPGINPHATDDIEKIPVIDLAAPNFFSLICIWSFMSWFVSHTCSRWLIDTVLTGALAFWGFSPFR